MSKISQKRKERNIEKAARIKKTARIVGVSERLCRMVLAGDRQNENVVSTMIQLEEMETEAENILLKEVNKLVPFN